MTTETEKAPEGAQAVESNPDAPIPESQGFLDAKRWLGRTVAGKSEQPLDWWDATEEEREIICEDAWAALVAVHGELSARLVLATKYDTVKGGNQ